MKVTEPTAFYKQSHITVRLVTSILSHYILNKYIKKETGVNKENALTILTLAQSLKYRTNLYVNINFRLKLYNNYIKCILVNCTLMNFTSMISHILYIIVTFHMGKAGMKRNHSLVKEVHNFTLYEVPYQMSYSISYNCQIQVHIIYISKFLLLQMINACIIVALENL